MTTETLSVATVEATSRPEIIEGERALLFAKELANDARNTVLEPGVFIDPRYLQDNAHGQAVELKCGKEIIDWPLGSIVGAEGFSSWELGNVFSDDLKDHKTSAQIMKDYSELPTDIPPIDFGLEVYLTPTGRIFASSHNAHRVGAAKLKEQKSIGVDTELCGIVVRGISDEAIDKALSWVRGEW